MKIASPSSPTMTAAYRPPPSALRRVRHVFRPRAACPLWRACDAAPICRLRLSLGAQGAPSETEGLPLANVSVVGTFDESRPRQLPKPGGFRLALRRFLAASEAISRAAGITQQQYQALLAVKTGPGEMTIGDLADQLLLTHHAAVQLVDRMARAGLAERAPSRTDRRSVHVRLTAAGDAMVGQIRRGPRPGSATPGTPTHPLAAAAAAQRG